MILKEIQGISDSIICYKDYSWTVSSSDGTTRVEKVKKGTILKVKTVRIPYGFQADDKLIYVILKSYGIRIKEEEIYFSKHKHFYFGRHLMVEKEFYDLKKRKDIKRI
jgi:hypothetical protein